MAEERKYEKKLLPVNKPILAWFGTVPKEGKPSMYQGKESPRVTFMFTLGDNKYSDLVGYRVFKRVNPWVNGGGDKRNTASYDILTEMLQMPLPSSVVATDLRDWPAEEWRAFYGPVVLKFGDPEYEEDGKTIRWQDISEILNPAGIEFDVDKRKADVTGSHRGTSPTPPKTEEASAPATGNSPLDEIKAYYALGPKYAEAVEKFRARKNGMKVSAMGDEDLKWLQGILKLIEIESNNGAGARVIGDTLKARKKTYVYELERTDVGLCLTAAEKADEDDTPF